MVGSLEQWGLKANQELEALQLTFANLTVQQAKQLLQRLPSTLKGNLAVQYKEEGEA